MAAVTQRIQNFLGGVSKQSDDIKLPGQVRECYNAYPDPTFGLTKRPGFQHLLNLGIGDTYDDGKWFYINRDNDEEYIGVIHKSSGSTLNALVTGDGTSGATSLTGVTDVLNSSGCTTGFTVDLTATAGVVTSITLVTVPASFICGSDTGRILPVIPAAGDSYTIPAATAGTATDVTFTLTQGNTISIWNAVTGATCTVTQIGSAFNYLNASKDNFKVVTVQDTSIIINNSVTVTERAAPSFTANTHGTLVLKNLSAGLKYKITLEGHSATVEAQSSDTYDTQLDPGGNVNHHIRAAIDNIIATNSLGITVERFKNTLYLSKGGSSFTFSGEGETIVSSLEVFQDSVSDISDLPAESKHGTVIKVINTFATTSDDFYVKFIAEDGISGLGGWEETIAPGVSPGLTKSTMPHELVNTGVNVFEFRELSLLADRLTGDAETSPNPGFVGTTISAGFFHNNRLGFLSNDKVVMSRSGDFYNFFPESAQLSIDSDPIDISCSSTRATSLNAAIPTAQGLVLFSADQQFLLFSDTGVLTPSLSTIRTLSNYEIDPNITPVDVGTVINFVSKTPGYSRVFGMVTKGQQENPQVLEVSRVVKEWITPDMDHLITSPQNSLICLSGQSSKDMYIFRYYNDGEKNLMESWVSWKMPGTVQFTAVETDNMYAVTKQGNQFTLLKAAISQSPEQAIIVNNKGQRVNPCVDLYATASSVTYDAATKTTKCYLPFNDVSDLTPIIVIKGTTQTGSFVESGFTVTPERGTDGTGDYFSITNKDLTGVASDVIVGFKYNFDVELPRTYFRPQQVLTDFTANLTVARMKFSVGLSGMMSFKLQQTGRLPYELKFTGDGSTTSFNFNKRDLDYVLREDVKVTVNGVTNTDFSFTNDTTIVFTTAPANNAEIRFYIEEWFSVQPVIEANTYLANDVPLDTETVFTLPIHQRTENFRVRMFNNSPFPVAINAMMWEGQYTPRFYKRV